MGSVFGKVEAKEPQYQKLKSEPYEVRAYNASVVAEVGCDEAANDAFNTLAKFIGAGGTPENLKAVPALSTEGEVKVATYEKIAMITPVLTQKNVMQFIMPSQYERPDQVPTPSNANVIIKAVPARIVAVYKFSGMCTPEQCVKKLKKLHKMLVDDHMVEDTAALPLPVSSASSASEEPGQLASGGEGEGPAKSAAAPIISGVKGPEEPAGEQGPAPEGAAKEEAKAAAKEGAAPESSVADSLVWLVAQYHPPWTLPFMRRNEVWVELDPQIPAIAKLIQKHDAASTAAKAAKDTAQADHQGVGEKSGEGSVKEGSVEAQVDAGQDSAADKVCTDAGAEAPSLFVQQPAVPAGEGVSGAVGVPVGASDKEHVGFTTPPAGPEAEVESK